VRRCFKNEAGKQQSLKAQQKKGELLAII